MYTPTTCESTALKTNKMTLSSQAKFVSSGIIAVTIIALKDVLKFYMYS